MRIIERVRADLERELNVPAALPITGLMELTREP
jgi:hypothetical protein